MRRLIFLCYKYRGFAEIVLDLYAHDPDHARSEEWGIDKGLLCVHAAHSLTQDRHRLPLLLVSLLCSVVPFAAILPLLVMSRRTRDPARLGQHLKLRTYDPTQVPQKSLPAINVQLRRMDLDVPENLYFFSAYDPFQQTGAPDSTFSFMVDRRKRTGGESQDSPAELSLQRAYDRIVQRVCEVDTESGARYLIDDVAFVAGGLVDPRDERFMRHEAGDDYPRNRIDPVALEVLRLRPEAASKIYKRIQLYDPRQDLRLSTFIHMEHRGPFTYIEVVGTRLLPLNERIFGEYTERSTKDEVEKAAGFNWAGLWSRMDTHNKLRLVWIVKRYLAVLALFLVGAVAALGLMGDGGSMGTAIMAAAPHMILLSVMARRALKASPPTRKQRPRHEIRQLKQARAFNFGPERASLRCGQSRDRVISLFEHTHLRVTRYAHDQAIQEAFIECLEEAGIDTSDFRKGTANINNYGIINSGTISGDARSAANGTAAKAPAREQAPRAEGQKAAPKQTERRA